MEGHRDLVIGPTRGLGTYMCLLSISVKNTRPEVVKLTKIAKIAVFQDLYGIERKVIESSEILENDFGGVGACSCSLNTCFFFSTGLFW